MDQDEPEMLVDEDDEEEHDDEEWAEYEANEAAWKNQEQAKGTSSKDSSFIFVESARDSPKDASSTTKGKLLMRQVQRQMKHIQRVEKKQQAKT